MEPFLKFEKFEDTFVFVTRTEEVESVSAFSAKILMPFFFFYEKKDQEK